jgi:hypothetical protein
MMVDEPFVVTQRDTVIEGNLPSGQGCPSYGGLSGRTEFVDENPLRCLLNVPKVICQLTVLAIDLEFHITL